ncbi:hypothetical protein I4F81_004984 [Pyropia yezoensis]|uniref:Uncharacterized protein n=1 Tax=Pyropia yezoensis TaxID=2788 RepID=A0ACC3BWS8_PYRYE|nr:hypothetical protein I4F81_004984 [Neopyropia yezoensis]
MDVFRAATGTAAPGTRTTPGCAVEEDPRLLCAAAAALSRAAAVLAENTLMMGDSWGLGTNSATDAYHALAVRMPDDGSVPSPAAGGASDDDAVKAAAQAVLAAAGATIPPQQHIHARRHGWEHAGSVPLGPAWSSHAARPLFHACITRRALCNGPYWWTAGHDTPCASHPCLRAGYGPLEGLLGHRPLLAFEVGDYMMHPVGGPLLMRWSPSLAVGFLLERECSF